MLPQPGHRLLTPERFGSGMSNATFLKEMSAAKQKQKCQCGEDNPAISPSTPPPSSSLRMDAGLKIPPSPALWNLVTFRWNHNPPWNMVLDTRVVTFRYGPTGPLQSTPRFPSSHLISYHHPSSFIMCYNLCLPKTVRTCVLFNMCFIIMPLDRGAGDHSVIGHYH